MHAYGVDGQKEAAESNEADERCEGVDDASLCEGGD